MELSRANAVDTNSHPVLNTDVGHDHGADLSVHDQGEGEVGSQSLSHGADLSVHDQGEAPSEPANTDAPSIFTSPSNEWFCIQNLFPQRRPGIHPDTGQAGAQLHVERAR